MSKKKRKMIVKVQLSIFTSEEEQQVLIYSKGGENWYQGPANPFIVKMMDGAAKAFFHAYVPYESGQIELLEEAPEQDW